jgi:hypothetical protein
MFIGLRFPKRNWRSNAKTFAKNVFCGQERKLEVRKRSSMALLLTVAGGVKLLNETYATLNMDLAPLDFPIPS